MRHCKYFYVCKVTTGRSSTHSQTAVHVVAFPHEPERVGVFCRNLFTRISQRGLSAGLTAARFYRYAPLQSIEQLFATQSMKNATIVQEQLPDNKGVLIPYLCYLKHAQVHRGAWGPFPGGGATSPSHSSHSTHIDCSDNGSCGSLHEDNAEHEASLMEDERPNTFIVRQEQLVEKALAFSMHDMNVSMVRSDLRHVLSAMYQASGMRLHSDVITHGIPQCISDEFTSRADDEFADRFSPFYFANLICTHAST